MKKTSRDVEVDAGKPVMLRREGRRVYLSGRNVCRVYPEQCRRAQHYQLKRDAPLKWRWNTFPLPAAFLSSGLAGEGEQIVADDG
jgi:hypothetical protein